MFWTDSGKMETKKEIRKRILNRRDELSEEEHNRKSSEITKKLIEMQEYKHADKVLCYASYRSEVWTEEITEQLFADGKKVYFPLVCGDLMRFFQISSQEELVSGYKGIREPVFSEAREYQKNADGTDIILLPGAVFDTEGNRIGYGRGYYDRFLAGSFIGHRIALAYELQVVEAGSFTAEEQDIKADRILTESRVIVAESFID